MADLNRRVEILFEARDNFSGALSKIEGSTARVTSLLSGATTSLIKFEAGVALAGGALLAFAVNESAKFESAQADLKKALDESDPSLESFTSQVDALSLRFGQAGTVILGGIANFRNAGFAAEESAKLIESALNLQIAGDVPLEQTFADLITIVRGFRLEVDEVPRAIEAINNVSQESGARVGPLIEALGVVGAQAQLAGLSLEETTAQVAPIIELFQSGSEAGTAFSAALSILSDDAKPVFDALNRLGISQRELNGELRPAGDILGDIAIKFQDLDDAQKLAFSTQIFGREQAKRLIVVFRDLNETTRLTNSAFEVTGSVTKEVDIRLEAFQKRLEINGIAFSNLARVIGDEFRPALGGSVDGLTDIFIAIKKVVEGGGLDNFFDAIRPRIEAFTKTLEDVARNLPEALGDVNFDGLLAAFDGLSGEIGDIFRNLFGNIDVTTPQGLADTIQRIVDAVSGLVRVTEGIVSQFQVVFRVIGEIVSQGSGLSEETQRNIGQLLGAVTLINELGLKLGAVALVLNQNKDAIDNVINVLGGGLIASVNALQVGFDTLSGAVVRFVLQLAQIADSIPGFDALFDTSGSVANLQILADSIRQNLIRNTQEGADGLLQMGRGLGLVADEADNATGKVDGVGRPVRDVADAADDASVKLLTAAEITAQLGDSFVDAGAKVGELVGPTQDAAENTDNLGKSLVSVASEADQAKNVLSKLGDFTKDTADELSGFNQVGLETSGTFSVLGGSSEKVADDLDKLKKSSEDARIELEKIASNERLQKLELQVEFNVAKLESDTKRVEAIIGGLESTFESTGDVISDAFGPLASLAESGASGFTAGFRLIEETLAEQNRIRAQITDAQVDALRVSTDLQRERLRRARAGDQIIKIEAPPELSEALEQIFDVFLRFTQVKANDEGLEILNLIANQP